MIDSAVVSGEVRYIMTGEMLVLIMVLSGAIGAAVKGGAKLGH